MKFSIGRTAGLPLAEAAVEYAPTDAYRRLQITAISEDCPHGQFEEKPRLSVGRARDSLIEELRSDQGRAIGWRLKDGAAVLELIERVFWSGLVDWRHSTVTALGRVYECIEVFDSRAEALAVIEAELETQHTALATGEMTSPVPEQPKVTPSGQQQVRRPPGRPTLKTQVLEILQRRADAGETNTMAKIREAEEIRALLSNEDKVPTAKTIAGMITKPYSVIVARLKQRQ